MKKKMITVGLIIGAMMMTTSAAFASENELCGAYETYCETGLSDDAHEAFDQAIRKYEGGEKLTPIQMISSQVVAGMNYRILCEKKSDDEPASKVIITIYKDLSGNCEVTEEKKVIAPVNENETIESDDFMMNAGFNVKDFDLENQTLSFELYDYARYDMVDMNQIEEGDFIEVDGQCLLVESKKEEFFTRTDEDGNEVKIASLTINQDTPFEQHFVADEGGTWIATMSDDHVVRIQCGKKTLPLSENMILKDITLSREHLEISMKDLPDYLEGLEGAYGTQFSPLNTKITVENGVITGIERSYMP